MVVSFHEADGLVKHPKQGISALRLNGQDIWHGSAGFQKAFDKQGKGVSSLAQAAIDWDLNFAIDLPGVK